MFDQMPYRKTPLKIGAAGVGVDRVAGPTYIHMDRITKCAAIMIISSIIHNHNNNMPTTSLGVSHPPTVTY